MEANELKIGNLVNHNIFGNCKITALDYEMICIQRNDLDIKEWFDLEDFNQIKLTEEWLFNFGFKYDNNWHYQIGENPLTKDYLLDLCWIDNTKFPFYRNGFFKIKSVHQLQNLYFALTGEELKNS